MNECWINVYEGGSLGIYHSSRYIAEHCKSWLRPTIYRIHVKLKPIKLADLSKGTEQWLK